LCQEEERYALQEKGEEIKRLQGQEESREEEKEVADKKSRAASLHDPAFAMPWPAGC
jgi:hypothetical protein